MTITINKEIKRDIFFRCLIGAFIVGVYLFVISLGLNVQELKFLMIDGEPIQIQSMEQIEELKNKPYHVPILIEADQCIPTYINYDSNKQTISTDSDTICLYPIGDAFIEVTIEGKHWANIDNKPQGDFVGYVSKRKYNDEILTYLMDNGEAYVGKIVDYNIYTAYDFDGYKEEVLHNFYIKLGLLVILMLLVFIRPVQFIIKPSTYPLNKHLSQYGNLAYIKESINEQLKNPDYTINRKGTRLTVFITKDWIVSINPLRHVVIPINQVQEVLKTMEKRRPWHPAMYCLSFKLKDNPKKSYLIDNGYSLADYDKIITYLGERNLESITWKTRKMNSDYFFESKDYKEALGKLK